MENTTKWENPNTRGRSSDRTPAEGNRRMEEGKEREKETKITFCFSSPFRQSETPRACVAIQPFLEPTTCGGTHVHTMTVPFRSRPSAVSVRWTDAVLRKKRPGGVYVL